MKTMRIAFVVFMGMMFATLAFAERTIILFGSENCEECNAVKDWWNTHATDYGLWKFEYLPIDQQENYKRLIDLEQTLSVTSDLLPVVYLEGRFLRGPKLTQQIEYILKPLHSDQTGEVAVIMTGGEAMRANDRRPELSCTNLSFHFGSVANTETVQHEFMLQNIGEDVLNISQIRPYCGCTATSPSNAIVMPQQTCAVSVSVSLRDRFGPQDFGVLVVSDDSRCPYTVLHLLGTALSEVELDPNRIQFGDLDAGAKTSKTVIITVAGTNLVRAVKVQSLTRDFEAQLDEVIPGKQYRVVVTTKPPLPASRDGFVNGNVRVYTDRPSIKYISISVSARRIEEFRITPSELVVRDGLVADQYVYVKPRDPARFRIERVELPDPGMTSVVTTLTNGESCIVIKDFPGDARMNGQSIRIITGADSGKVLVVPIHVVTGR